MTPEEIASAMPVDGNLRADFAARNRKRVLERREWQLHAGVCSVLAFMGFSLGLAALSAFSSGPGAIWLALVLGVMASLFVGAFLRLWLTKRVSIWLPAMPLGAFVVIGGLIGLWAGVPYWVNVAALLALPRLHAVRKELAALG